MQITLTIPDQLAEGLDPPLQALEDMTVEAFRPSNVVESIPCFLFV